VGVFKSCDAIPRSAIWGNLNKYKDKLFDGMRVSLEKSAKGTSEDNEQPALEETPQPLRQDGQLEEFVNAVPIVLLSDDKITFSFQHRPHHMQHRLGICSPNPLFSKFVRQGIIFPCFLEQEPTLYSLWHAVHANIFLEPRVWEYSKRNMSICA
jgi:hypothetical protein